MPDRPWTATQDGVRLRVRATPRAEVDAVDGVIRLADGRLSLKVRVRAAAADGKANAAIAELLATCGGVPKSAVRLLQGATGRSKSFLLSGNPQAIASMLENALVERGQAKP